MKNELKQVSIHEAKTHLSRLLKRAMKGEQIIIANGKNPVAKLVPFQEPQGPRKLGRDRTTVWMSEDFNAHLDPESFE